MLLHLIAFLFRFRVITLTFEDGTSETALVRCGSCCNSVLHSYAEANDYRID